MAEESAALRVMSFNIRVDFDLGVASDKPTAWISTADNHRRDRVIETIRDFDPDLLGLQEALTHQADAIAEALPGMSRYGVGRDDGQQAGERCTLLFKTTRFKQDQSGTFWLCDTPEVAGSQHPDAACVRIASWLRLIDRSNNRTLLVVNTHWDHVSQPARVKAAEVIRQFIIKRGTAKREDQDAVIVMGDFNAHADSLELVELRGRTNSNEPLLLDSYRTLYPEIDPDEATYQGFTNRTAGRRIDFILHSAELKPRSASIVRPPKTEIPPSDHYPVTAVLEFAE